MSASVFGPIKYDPDIYEEFRKRTMPHTKGYFILAPSGAGKTHYIKQQKEQHWIDGDLIWLATGAQPDTDWWNQGKTIIKEVDARSDKVTERAKQYGLWIMGASNSWLKPDAVVLPPWEVNVQRIAYREKNNYDGGLKTDKLDQLKEHREEIEETATRSQVPIFPSIEEAADYISDLYRKITP